MPDAGTHTANLARESLVISRLLRPARALDANDDGVALHELQRYAASQTSSWMRTLLRQTMYEPEEHTKDDPFAAYLQRTVDEIRARAVALTDSYTVDHPAVVCCVTRFIYEVTGANEVSEDPDRAVKEEEWRNWLHTLRETLLILRDLSQDSKNGQQLNILSIDISAAINESLASIALGPIVMVMVLMEFVVDYVSSVITNKALSTRCLPVIELWGILLSSIHDPRSGILQRMQGWASNLIIRQYRKLRSSYQLEGSVDVRSDGLTVISWARMNYLIALIDLLLDATTLFQTCRPDPVSDDDSTDTPRPGPGRTTPDEDDDTGRGGNRGEGEGPGSGTRGGGRGTTPGDGSADTRGGGRSPGDENRGGRPTTGTGTRSPQDSDYVYLTRTNIARFLTSEFALSDREAQELVQLDNCREQVSPETQAMLRAIGI